MHAALNIPVFLLPAAVAAAATAADAAEDGCWEVVPLLVLLGRSLPVAAAATAAAAGAATAADAATAPFPRIYSFLFL